MIGIKDIIPAAVSARISDRQQLPAPHFNQLASRCQQDRLCQSFMHGWR